MNEKTKKQISFVHAYYQETWYRLKVKFINSLSMMYIIVNNFLNKPQ